MFCPECGTRMPDDAPICTKCGKKVGGGSFTDKINESFDSFANEATQQARNAFNDVRDGMSGTPHSGKLATDRSILMYILFTLITCGLYGLYFIYALARDVNIACEGDGQRTRGLFQYFLLCIITCGLYALFWQYSIGNRLASNAGKYGLSFQENGTTVLMWSLLGSWLCGLGHLFAMYILIKNTNRIAEAYNQAHGLR